MEKEDFNLFEEQAGTVPDYPTERCTGGLERRWQGDYQQKTRYGDPNPADW